MTEYHALPPVLTTLQFYEGLFAPCISVEVLYKWHTGFTVCGVVTWSFRRRSPEGIHLKISAAMDEDAIRAALKALEPARAGILRISEEWEPHRKRAFNKHDFYAEGQELSRIKGELSPALGKNIKVEPIL